MADYLTTNTDLTAVADAIREKGGTSAALEWPSGYVDAIEAISSTPTLQSKSAYPLVASTYVYPDSGYDGLSSVAISAIPGPTCSIGQVADNSVDVTPKIVDHNGGIRTGNPVTVSASSLVSGTLNITENGVANVTNYASVAVDVGGGGAETAQITLYLNSETAWYTNASMQVCQAQIDFDLGQIAINDLAPIGSLVVVIDNLRPSFASGVTLVTSNARSGYYIYKVTG